MLISIMHGTQTAHKKNERFCYSNWGPEREFCRVCWKHLEKSQSTCYLVGLRNKNISENKDFLAIAQVLFWKSWISLDNKTSDFSCPHSQSRYQRYPGRGHLQLTLSLCFFFFSTRFLISDNIGFDFRGSESLQSDWEWSCSCSLNPPLKSRAELGWASWGHKSTRAA